MQITTTLKGIEDVDRLLSRIAPREGVNLMRATVHDMAKQVRDDARAGMPVDDGVMVAVTKHRREKTTGDRARSTVRVGPDAFYWRFLEYGDGPDGVAYDFFLRAVQLMRTQMEFRFLTSFGAKFEKALERRRRRR